MGSFKLKKNVLYVKIYKFDEKLIAIFSKVIRKRHFFGGKFCLKIDFEASRF